MPMTVQCGSQPLQGAVRAGAFLAAVLLPLLAHSAAVERPAVIVSSGGNYQVFWNSIDAGGTRSSAGSYAVQGVIGQADAARSAAGSYQLLAGFLPTKAAPLDGLFANGFE